MIISLIVSLTYFESKSSSHEISARVNSRADTMVIVMKFLLIYIYAFLYKEEYHWFIIAVLLIVSFTSYSNYRNGWPYYSDRMNKLDVKRIRGKLSQSQFAELLGVSVRTLQGWEQGQHEPNASAVALLRLAESGALTKRKR